MRKLEGVSYNAAVFYLYQAGSLLARHDRFVDRSSHDRLIHDAATLDLLTWPSGVVLLQSVPFECLLVLELLLGVFVPLQLLIVLDLAQLQTLVHLS